MNVTCPGCSTRYALPPRLLGPAGARVCCPSCWLTFVLGPAGELAAVLGQDEPAGPTAAGYANGAGAPGPEPLAVAEAGDDPGGDGPPVGAGDPVLEVLRALDAPPGSLAAAAGEGRLFTVHGRALVTAFEALREELPDVDVAACFRAALREVAGVELEGTPGAGELSGPGKV